MAISLVRLAVLHHAYFSEPKQCAISGAALVGQLLWQIAF